MGIVVVTFLAANVDGVCNYEQIDFKTDQICRKRRQPLNSFTLCKPELYGYIFSLNPAKIAQLLAERLHEDRATGSSAWIQETYAENFSWLLGVGGKPKS